MNHEQIRQQVAKQYKEKIRNLEAENRRYKKLYLEEQDKRIELETQLAEKQDWIDRLLEFTELSPEQVRASVESKKALSNLSDSELIDLTSDVFSSFFWMLARSMFNGIV